MLGALLAYTYRMIKTQAPLLATQQSTNVTAPPLLRGELGPKDQPGLARAASGDLVGAVEADPQARAQLEREAQKVVLAAQTPSELQRESAAVPPPNFRLGPNGMVSPRGRDGSVQGEGFFTPSSLRTKFGAG